MCVLGCAKGKYMLEVGALVDGKYRILSKIGQGGMSCVYLARNERANKQWAIKEVRKDGVQDYDVVKQGLIAEVDMLKRFNHPNLPSIIDVIDGDGSFLIVMDYVEGNALDKAIEATGAQSQENVINWAKQLCDVLGYLHSRTPPIIYRDMKPSNVMLKPDGSVVLIDFGTAREYKSTSIEDTKCLGTQGYAAPEQYGGHGQTDARTDIYCLGATMYHLVTGHNPSHPPYEMYPIRYWNPTLSSGLEQIILKCTQKDPANRYQSCAELYYDLEHYRDLDIENQRKYNFKWKLFLSSCILSVVMGVSSGGLAFAMNSVSADTYDSYMKLANNDAADYEEKAENYKNAIHLKPEKSEAYSALLELFLDEDSDGGAGFSENEYKFFVSGILESPNENDTSRTNGDILLSENPSDYAKIALTLGNDCYFSYGSRDSEDDNGDVELAGRRKSKKWYDSALSTGELDDDDSKRAETLSTMAENLSNLGKMADDGSEKMSYPDYWYNIKDLVRSARDGNTTAKIQISIYHYTLSEIISKSGPFLNKASVSVEELNKVIDNIESYVAQDDLKRELSKYNEASDVMIKYDEITGTGGEASLLEQARESVRISMETQEKRKLNEENTTVQNVDKEGNSNE